jgi:hypothetical protein
MRRLGIALGFALVASIATAHEYVIEPVNVELKLEPTLVRVRIDSHARYWIDEILRVPLTKPLPAKNWPSEFESAAKSYVDKSFELRIDGRPLAYDGFVCIYAQEPLNPSSERVIFEIRYPISSVGKIVSGRAQFFGEYRAQELREHGGQVGKNKFVTNLRIAGEKSANFEIPYEKPEFQTSTDGLLRTRFQQLRERTNAFLFRVTSSFVFWIVLIAIAVKIYTRYFKRRQD